jgi:putative redox protein
MDKIRESIKSKIMKHHIETQWMGKMQFNTLVNGHTIIMDAPEKAGGEDAGPIPKPLVLTALTGCTGMDVIALLRRSGYQLDNLTLRAEGEISKQSPIEYTAIHLVYDLTGDETVKDHALHAVTASQEKICGVSHMLKKILPLTWEVIYNGKLVFSNKEERVLV